MQVSVDYDQLELLHHHRQGHEERGQLRVRGMAGVHRGRGSSVSPQEGDQVLAACGAPGSGRRMGLAGRGRGGGTRRRSSVRLYTNPENVGARRGGVRERHQQMSRGDHRSGLEVDSVGTFQPSHPASSRRVQPTLRGRDNGFDQQRVTSQQPRRRTGL